MIDRLFFLPEGIPVLPGIIVLLGIFWVLGYGLTYFVLLQIGGLWTFFRPTKSVQAESIIWYFLIPCLNEEQVIADTVRNVLDQPGNGFAVVIDDGSTDRTGAVATAAGGDRVLLVRRDPPHAREGKGRALNAGLRAIEADVRARGHDASRVIVCVMDADGQLSPQTTASVAALFADERTGAVQLPVRIRNRHGLLARIQDSGFSGSGAFSQMGRDVAGAVSLGGNGQFARLTALRSVGATPWSQSLTEDLDLTISLAVRGWRTRVAAHCHVNQEAPEDFHSLLIQRTRWSQGHMVCAGRIFEVWRARQLPTAAALELTMYLFQPWLSTLPWSIITPALAVVAGIVLGSIGVSAGVLAALGTLFGGLLIAAVPIAYRAIAYSRLSGDYGFARSLWLQVASLYLAFVVALATWRALGRILQGRTNWDKTARVKSR